MASDLQAGDTLPMLRCPHCQIAKPLLQQIYMDDTASYEQAENWHVYRCTNCTCMVLVRTKVRSGRVANIYPDIKVAPRELPESARRYLAQAYRTVQDAPDAAAIMASSAIDDMLKQKGFTDQRTLHERIDAAKDQHLLTEEMAKWAHRIRFVSNNPRHADEDNPHVEAAEAQRMLDFAEALAQYLYVLPELAREDTEAE